MQLLSLFTGRFWHRLLDFLIIQWCIMLASWPIMLAWGLPVPSLSPIGNFVFGPFLTVFLSISTLLTVAAAFSLPVWPLTAALEYTIQAWFYLLDLTPWDWNILFPRPPLLIMLLAPLGTLVIMHCIPLRAKPHRCFVALFTYSFFLLTIFSLVPAAQKTVMPWGGKRQVEVTRQQDGLIVAYDNGFVRRSSSIQSWINYTLLPQLALAFGRNKIDAYVLDKATPGTLAFAQLLCSKQVIRALYLPVLPKKLREEKEELEKVAKENQVSIFLMAEEKKPVQ